MIKRLLSAAIALFVIINSYASENKLVISDNYIRETIPGTKISSAYMVIRNNSDKPIKLVGAASNASKRVEIHEHVMTEDMMRMQQVNSVTIAANSELVFEPMGYHLMMFDLSTRLKQGESYPITLQFSDHPDISIEFPVKSIKRMHHHH